jgi:hypothetical protein
VETPDSLLGRLQRDATIWCLATAGLALLIRGRADVSLGILGGGVLSAVSYWAIKSGIDSLLAAATAPAASGGIARGSAPRRKVVWLLVRLAGRYALLTFLAYVMIARLRLHPIGLLAGVSSLVVAAAVEAARILSRPRSPGRR